MIGSANNQNIKEQILRKMARLI